MLTVEKVKDLLGVKELPGEKWQVDQLMDETEELLERHGEQWIRDNRGRLLKEWEMSLEMMSGIPEDLMEPEEPPDED